MEDRVLQQLTVAIGVVGAILLILGLIFLAYGFSFGIGLAGCGLITIVVVLIVYVVATYGVDTEVGAFSGPKFPPP